MFSNSINKSIFIYLSFSGTNLLLCGCVGQTIHTIRSWGQHHVLIDLCEFCAYEPIVLIHLILSLACSRDISLCLLSMSHVGKGHILHRMSTHVYTHRHTLMRCIYTRGWYHFLSLFKLTTQINSRKCLSRVQNTRKCHCQSNAYFKMSIENPMSKQNVLRHRHTGNCF